MMEENVVSATGTTFCLNEPTICHLIRDAGFVPAQRDNRYQVLKAHDGTDSPDLLVKDWSTQRVAARHEAHGDNSGKNGTGVSRKDPS